jgi:hypothetical protein
VRLVDQLKEHKILFSVLTGLVCVFILLLVGDLLTSASTTEGSNKVVAVGTLIVAIANLFLVLVTVALAVATYKSLQYSRKANGRVERRFVAENKPLIDVVPTAVRPLRDRPAVEIHFDLFNYSGFRALNVDVDAKYGANDWIAEWLTAALDSRRKQKAPPTDSDDNGFYRILPQEVFELYPGQGVRGLFVRGSLDLEEAVCKRENRSDGLEILFRIRWRNEYGFSFDEIREFRLICTPVDIGRSYTLIPKGTQSKKGF